MSKLAKPTIGVPVVEVKINHFAMVLTKEQSLSPLPLPLKKQKQRICAAVKKLAIHHSVMVAIANKQNSGEKK